MTQSISSESLEEQLLKKLESVGAKGCSKSALVGQCPNRNQSRVLNQLVRKDIVARHGAEGEPNTLFFAKNCQPTHQSVSAEIREHLQKLGDKLVTAHQLAAKLKNSYKITLLKEVIASDPGPLGLRPFKYQSQVLYAYLPRVLESVVKDKSFNAGAVLRSFRELEKETGSPNIYISSLAERSECDLRSLHEYLLNLVKEKEGRVTLSVGDWNATPEKAKEAVLEYLGKRYVLARLLS